MTNTVQDYPCIYSHTACQCSPLAVSSECDLVTGACQCVEGAIGLKCDDCAFGFTGWYFVQYKDLSS